MTRWLMAVACVLAITISFWQLHAGTDGLTVATATVGAIPVTVFRPAAGGPAPVVVIAHGFAGSQQLMQPFAETLARNGYIAVTFDFPGHGRNPTPLAGGLGNDAAASGALLGALGEVAAFAATLPDADGKLALLGHSMASDIVIRYAKDHPEVTATIAISVFSPAVTGDRPRDLLVIVGALEPAMLQQEGARIVGMAAHGPVTQHVTYGSLADGTARQLVLARGVEHISVLYSHDSLAAAVAWLDAVDGRQSSGALDARGRWLGLLFLGIVALGWPLAGLLPRAAARPLGAGLRWRKLLPLALGPAIATPLLLWRLPTDFLPILLGDYLVVHFFVYGALTALGLWIFRAPHPAAGVSLGALALAAAAVGGYAILALGLPINAYVTSFMPIPARVPLILAMLCGTLPWFLADEWLTRGAGSPRGAYAFTKLCFLLSLAVAIALNLHRLFFLIIIVPVILVLFVIYGLFSAWSYRATNHPLAAALGNAAALAWGIAVTFPMVGR
jgi:dienelactone hydrolase